MFDQKTVGNLLLLVLSPFLFMFAFRVAKCKFFYTERILQTTFISAISVTFRNSVCIENREDTLVLSSTVGANRAKPIGSHGWFDLIFIDGIRYKWGRVKEKWVSRL